VNNARLYAAVQRYAEELKASQDRLVESERMAAMGKLSAAIAHEINNPLQAIQTHLGLALEEAEAGEPVDPDNLRIAASEIQRTGQLIHQFLDFYRPAVGETALVDVDIILDEVLRLVEQKLSKAQVRLERHWSPTRPMVRAHAGRLKQVFLNLLLNAIEAMPNGGQIGVCTEVEGEQVRVHVSDTGHGIPPEVMPHLFEPFFTTKTRGIGMGLFVSQGIIHHYGGDIRVTSPPGQGTTFTVSLPCSAEQGEKAP
jgi:two-component system NtrC family sensor kinase